MDKEILNPKTKNKIKVRTALQLPDEHPENKKAKDMVAKTSIDKGDVGGPAHPNVPKDKPKEKSRPKAMDDLDWDDEIEPHELEGWIQDNQKNIPNSSMKAIDGWMDDYEEYWSKQQYDHASAVQYKMKKELERYMRESVHESNTNTPKWRQKQVGITEEPPVRKRTTVKEVRMWMKKLEEIR